MSDPTVKPCPHNENFSLFTRGGKYLHTDDCTCHGTGTVPLTLDELLDALAGKAQRVELCNWNDGDGWFVRMERPVDSPRVIARAMEPDPTPIGADRNANGADNTHPTVKPTDLMRWLVRLVTPPGGVVLDPFAGSGSTLLAARAEGFKAIGIEREEEYARIAAQRLSQLSLLGGDA